MRVEQHGPQLRRLDLSLLNPGATITTAIRKYAILIGASFLAVAGTTWGLLLATAEADHPVEADLISERCASFSKATVWIAFRAGILHSNFFYLLNLNQDGRIGVDSVAGMRERFYWDGQQLTVSRSVNPAPRVVAGYDEIIADVWSECRAGFENSTWADAAIPVGAAAGPRHYLALDLPFEWAAQLQVRVAYKPGSGELSNVVILDSNGAFIREYDLVGENWTADFPPQALGPDVPPFLPPKWPGWEWYDAVDPSGRRPIYR